MNTTTFTAGSSLVFASPSLGGDSAHGAGSPSLAPQNTGTTAH